MEIPEPTNLVLAIMGATLFGLLSVPHCMGMCGPLQLAVCLSGAKRSFRALSLFNLGRIAGYTLIGLLCGLFGSQISEFLEQGPPQTVVEPAPDSHVMGQSGEESEQDMEHGHKKTLWRRCLMFLFPAAILMLTGIKALRKKPAVVGENSGGVFSRLFNRFRAGGPALFGLAASLLPCGMLYYAFAVAVSTLSPLLGATFLFVYCVTISFFMQLGIMVGATFGRKLGPKVDRAFPWLAFTGAGVYVTLFLIR